MQKPASLIEGEKVRLRPLEERDLTATLEWRNLEHIRTKLFHSEPISADQHRAWFEIYQNKDDDIVFIIESKLADCRPVGQISLYHIDRDSRRAEFGRLMIGVREAAERGLAKEATLLILDFAFGILGLREVYLQVYEDNSRAIGLYTACGFSETKTDGRVLNMARRS